MDANIISENIDLNNQSNDDEIIPNLDDEICNSISLNFLDSDSVKTDKLEKTNPLIETQKRDVSEFSDSKIEKKFRGSSEIKSQKNVLEQTSNQHSLIEENQEVKFQQNNEFDEISNENDWIEENQEFHQIKLRQSEYCKESDGNDLVEENLQYNVSDFSFN